MRRNRAVLFVHLVWRTWDRLPLIRPEIERELFRLLSSEAERMKCTVIAINGTEDHVHVLARIPTSHSVADIVKQLKGVTSHWVNAKQPGAIPFKWQGHYGVFTVSRWDVDKIAQYIHNQKEHHATGNFVDDLEQTDEEVD
jgi:putative transposase